jgi:hypothetical protein
MYFLSCLPTDAKELIFGSFCLDCSWMLYFKQPPIDIYMSMQPPIMVYGFIEIALLAGCAQIPFLPHAQRIAAAARRAL